MVNPCEYDTINKDNEEQEMTRIRRRLTSLEKRLMMVLPMLQKIKKMDVDEGFVRN
jgi:hypothetical protein